MALDRDGIKAVIPHREPFLLIDRIEEYVPGESAVGYLDVTSEMFWVPGHFPDYAVMPGVLIVEACAQVGAVALLSLDENRGRIAFFAGIDKVRFKRQVRPGDTLRMETLSRGIEPIWLNEDDAGLAGIRDNDWVEVVNDHGVVVTRACVSDRMPRGMCFIYHATERTVGVPKSQLRGNRRAGARSARPRP